MSKRLARVTIGAVLAASAILACSLRDTSYLQAGGGQPVGPGDGGTDSPITGDGGEGAATRTATTMATGQLAPQYLTQDDANVYWVSEANVLALKKDGSEPMPRVVTNAAGVTFLVAEEGAGPNLFFTSGSEVKTVPKAGGTPATIATTTPPPRALAVDPEYVFAMADDADLLEQGTLIRYLHDGGAPVAVRAPDDTSTVVAVAVQGADVYWDEGANDFFSLPRTTGPDAGAKKYSVSGDDIESAYTPLAFAVDDRAIYYSNGTDVRAFAKTPTGTATQLIGYSAEADVSAIAIDDKFVYAIDGRASGSLRRNGKDGRTAPELMLDNLGKPTSLAVDATSVYVAVQGPPGAILKCPK